MTSLAPEVLARPDDVVAALVTYGDRRPLLLAVLDRLREEGVGHVVVVDNGAKWPVAAELSDRFGTWASTLTLATNTGSACGFAAALERASRSPQPFVWILDDDNRPQTGCLTLLLDAWCAEAEASLSSLLAVVASRAEHSTAHVSARQLLTRWDSFGGFHVADVADKLAHRLPRKKPLAHARVQVGVTHFGGMLFHRSLIERIGLPRADFFMYAEDTEFTWRITAAGGRVVQVIRALIDDLEPARQRTADLRNRFTAALLAESNFRTFYAVRNLACFERHFRRRNRFIFALNQRLYFALLRFYAHRLSRMAAYRFIRASASEGLAGRLGPDPRFPLR